MTVEFGALFPAERMTEVEKLEEWGYDAAWSSEHILFYGVNHEAIPVLAAFAGRTKRIKLGTAVYLLPLRHATITAKSVATLDILSGGRTILGIGVGGEYPKEFESVGVNVKERGARTNEAIPLLRRLWSEEHVTHDGKFFPLDDVSMNPHPPQGANLPIWVAGRSEAAIRRAGLMGDAFFPYLYTASRLKAGLEQARAIAAEAGRDPAAVKGAIYQFISMDSTYEAAHKAAVAALTAQYNQPFDEIAAKYCVIGTATDCAQRLAELAEAGAEHIVLAPIGNGDIMERLQSFAEDVFPAVR